MYNILKNRYKLYPFQWKNTDIFLNSPSTIKLSPKINYPNLNKSRQYNKKSIKAIGDIHSNIRGGRAVEKGMEYV